MEMNFFIITNGLQDGPYTIAQLAEKKITSETLVWREGMKDWQPAWTVPELRYILEENMNRQNNPSQSAINNGTSSNSNVPPVPPTNQAGNTTGSNAGYKIFGGLIILLILIMAVTNPSKESHEKAIRTEVSKAIDKTTSNGSNDIFSQGFGMIARMIAGNIMDSAFDNLFEYHNYILFSKGTVTLNETSHTVSYGIFGKVITMNADDMIKAIENNGSDTESNGSDTDKDMDADSPSSSDNDQNSDNAQISDNPSDESNSNSTGSLQERLQDKADKAVDRMVDKASKKVEEKINQKLDEVTDSSTIEKLIDKILNLL